MDRQYRRLTQRRGADRRGILTSADRPARGDESDGLDSQRSASARATNARTDNERADDDGMVIGQAAKRARDGEAMIVVTGRTP